MNQKQYRNVFLEAGYGADEIEKRVEDTFWQIFYGPDKFYYENADGTGYVMDTGNYDVRTEGMSYAMMMCVQLGKKKEFDALWKWARTYMYMEEGVNKGYFAWSVHPDGRKNSYGPAPDGEEFFALDLFFASHQFGDGEGILNYSKEAKDLLATCVHKGEDGVGFAMWNPDNYLIRFIPDREFTDPSYHLPHFYQLFSMWAYEEDQEFWKIATEKSREYLKKACHPVTGLSAEYSTFSGEPYYLEQEIFGRHDWYFSDAYRTIANVALDYEWFTKDTEEGSWNKETTENLQKFFCETVADKPRAIYTIDGQLAGEEALHPVAITATNAQASLASSGPYALNCVKEFWNTPLRTGDRRYYDNCLYLFAMLALSGKYRIW
jgi:oligosaccharide reducing-end xylanase